MTLAVAAVTDAAVAKTSWDTAKLEVVQGDNVTITCSATDVGPMDVLRVFHQECLFHDVKSTIADNDHLKPEFARTNRYTVVYDYDNAMRRASLQVTFTGKVDLFIENIRLPCITDQRLGWIISKTIHQCRVGAAVKMGECS